MRNVVLVLLLSFGCADVCVSNINPDSVYYKAFYTDSLSNVIQLTTDFEKICNSVSDYQILNKLYFLTAYRARYKQKASLAFSYYYKCYELAKQLRDNDRQRSVMLNTAALFYSVNDFVNAKKYKLRAIEYAEELGQKDNVAFYLYDMGLYSRKQGETDSAIYYLEQSYRIARDLGNLKRQALVLNELGLCAYDIEKYQDALDYYYMALNLNDTSNYIRYMVYTNHGEIEAKRGNLSKSRALLDQAIVALKKWSIHETEFIPLHNLLGEIYMKSEQYDSALVIFTKALFLNDYNGFKGANTEEFYITIGFLRKLQVIYGEKNLFIHLGVDKKYEEFLAWQAANQIELDKLNEMVQLQIKSERIISEEQQVIKRKQWLLGGMLLLVLVISIFMIRRRKKQLLLQKIANFDAEFEKRYNSDN